MPIKTENDKQIEGDGKKEETLENHEIKEQN